MLLSRTTSHITIRMATEPLRVFVRVSSKSGCYLEAWNSLENIIAFSLDALKNNSILDTSTAPQLRLIAVDRYHMFTLIVFDIFHDMYDASRGHLPDQNNLHLYQVFISSNNNRDTTSVRRATEGVRVKVNEEIRKLYDLNGEGGKPPFKADHLDGNAPVYWSPRSSVSKAG